MMSSEYFLILGLAVILVLTLILPFSVKRIEEELEAFLFVMGIMAVTISKTWSGHLIKDAFKEPVGISLAVLITGFIFKAVRPHIKHWLNYLITKLGISKTIFLIIMFLGLGSSIFTAIISSLVLAEIITILKFERKVEIKTVVYACFAIGLGAALTPIGEPLSTIAVAKLKAPPHNADFFYLIKLIGIWIIPGVILTAILASLNVGRVVSDEKSLKEDAAETNKSIVIRAFKIYLFVMALIFLGSGLTPLAEKIIARCPMWLIYWVNSISAILDNATLVAAELVPSMNEKQITFMLVGLLISGGMLIPGNIPNIVSASKLGIKSKEWAKVALPYGAILMVVYFVLLMLVLNGTL